MADKRFVAKNGLDNNSQTITNVADPVNAQDAATRAFASNASNLTSGTLALARGGTGATTQAGAANAILPSQTSQSGKYLTTDGTNVSWGTISTGTSVTVSDDTATNATRYVVFEDATSGTVSTVNVSSTKLTFNPSTGTLAATVFSGSGASLTSLNAGNVSTGTLAVARGGTGLVSYTIGDLLYASGTTTLTALAGVATGNALISGGTGTAPSWGKIGLTTHVSGTLGAGNGGTGISSYTTGNYIYASGTTTLAQRTPAQVRSDISAEFQQTLGVPRANLGDPTVREVAMFDEQQDNKTAFHPTASFWVETSTDGTTWVDAGLTTNQKERLIGGDAGTSWNLPYNTPYVRVRMRATYYSYINALYAYTSTNGHTMAVQIYKKHDNDANWTQHTSSTTQVSTWPGHVYMPFTYIPWRDTATQGTHFHELYVVFIPTWNATYSANGITFYRFQLWGGYPAAKRNVFTTDEFKNINFPAAITATTVTATTYGGTFTASGASPTFNTGNTTGTLSLGTTAAISQEQRFRLVNSVITGGVELVLNAAGTNWGLYDRHASKWVMQITRGSPDATTLTGTLSTTGSIQAVGGSVSARAATGQDAVVIQGRAGGTSSYNVVLTPTTLSASRTLTLADGDTTLVAGTMVPTSRTLTITNGTGITGGGAAVDLSANRSWTIALTGQALAFHNLASNGLVARTAADTVAARTITGTANQVTVTNGDGVAGNPTLSLPADVDITTTLDVGSVGAITAATLRIGGDIRASGTIYANDFVLTGGAGSGTGLTLDSLDDVITTSPYAPTDQQVLTFDVAAGNKWIPKTVSGGGGGTSVTIADDTSTNGNRYLSFVAATSGTASTLNVASTKLTFNPSTGTLTAIAFSGSGASLTSLNASNVSTGTLALARGGTGATTQAGAANAILPSQTSQSGKYLTTDGTNVSWATVTTGSSVTVSDDTTTNATRYLLLEDVTSGTVSTVNVSSTKLTFNPSTGVLSASGGFSGLTSGQVTTALGYTPLSNATSYLPLGGGTMTGAITFAAGQSWPVFNQSTTGSAATLTTARNINGVSFNGSADITVAAAAGTLTGATLASGVTSSSLTTFGSVMHSGRWHKVYDYALNATPANGVQITTTIPFTSGIGMYTIICEGYRYGGAAPEGWMVSFYPYNGGGGTQLVNHGASSWGSAVPNLKLGVVGGVVCLFLEEQVYFRRFTLRMVYGAQSETASHAEGWTASDNTAATAGATNVITPTFTNAFGNVNASNLTVTNTISGSVSGTAANVTGTVAVANGGTGATTQAGARTGLGATTVGANLFTLGNPGAITFLRINADNTVSALDAATFRTAIGAGTGSGSGTVTSVAGTGTVSGLTLSGTVTTTGNLTLSGTLSVTPSNFASQTANTVLAAPNGSAGVPTFRTLVLADLPSSILRSVGHPNYGNWDTFGNEEQTVREIYQEHFNVGTNTGSSNFPSNASYKYGTLVNFGAGSSARAQVYISHAGNDLVFRGGWTTNSWQTWNRVLTDQNYTAYSPSLTGSGASGTWGINITGNAATATSATDSTKLPLAGGTLTGGLTGTTASFSGAVTWGAGSSVMNAGNPRSLRIGYSGGNYGAAGYGIDFTTSSGVHNYAVNDIVSYWEAYDGIIVRAAAGGTVGTAISWTNVLDARRSNTNMTFKGNVVLASNNYTSYSPSLTGTGASGSWGISITGNAATVTNGVYVSGAQDISGNKRFRNTPGFAANSSSFEDGLSVYQATAGSDAMLTFHIAGDWAGHLGLGGAENDLVWTGWSVGNTRHRILHSGNYNLFTAQGSGINYASSVGWTTTNGTQTGYFGGNFGINGDGSENQNLYRGDTLPTPFASPGLVWVAQNNDTSSNADGGWDKTITGLDPNKTYRSIVWFRRNSSSTNGTWYHGCADCLYPNGNAVNNPYFNSQGIGAFTQGRWYLSVGYIHANNDGTATSNYGGVYDSVTGAKVFSSNDFRMGSGQTTQTHRTYLYYSTDPAAVVEWWGPRFEEVNGNEPSVNSLLMGSPEQKVIVTSTNVGTYALPLSGGTMTGAITFAAGQTWPTFNQSTTGNAATATTLQTARNINGTSFNGSANITTASWGTARTITIGSTGKSVDGSANVSWTLGEIGALGASAKAADSELLDGLDSSVFVYGANGSGARTAAATQNVYELAQYKAGFWDANGAGWTPDNGWWWGATFAHVSNSGSYNYSGQLAFQNGGGGNNVYARTISNGSAGSWSRLLSSGNYNSYSPTLTGTGASGTWSINVTGTAGSISGFNNPTTAATANTIAYRDGSGQLTSVDFILSSDARLKTDLVPLTSALTSLDKLTAYRYTHTKNQRQEVGVIAQDVREVLPEAVTEAEDGTLGVSYDRLVPLLLAAVKELSAQVKALQTQH